MQVPDDCPLSHRELEVLLALIEHGSYKAVARELNIAESTVRTHLHNAYQLLKVGNVAQAVAAIGRRGWIGWTPDVDPDTSLADEHPILWAYLKMFDRARLRPTLQQRVAMRGLLAAHKLNR